MEKRQTHYRTFTADLFNQRGGENRCGQTVDGTKSPNLADSVMISYAPMNSAPEYLGAVRRQA